MRRCRFTLVVLTMLAIALAPLSIAQAMQDKQGAYTDAGPASKILEHCAGVKASENGPVSDCCGPDAGCEPEACAVNWLSPFNPPMLTVESVPDNEPLIQAMTMQGPPSDLSMGLPSPPPRS